jgi:SPP1 family predicted phage head-tail adaptor
MTAIPSDKMLNKTGIVYRRSAGATNEYGEKATAWATQVASFKCALQTNSSSNGEAQAIGGLMILATHILYCYSTTNIKAGDRVEVSSKLYDVKLVSNEAERDSHYKVYLNRITAAD